MGLIAEIGDGPVALDTAVFIYFIEEHPDFLSLVEPIFIEVAAGRLRAVTSAVTLLETLVVPYRAGDQALATRYEALLTYSRGLDLVDLDRPLLRAAAQLRARFGLRTPDGPQKKALQLLTTLGPRSHPLQHESRRALPPADRLRREPVRGARFVARTPSISGVQALF